MLVTIAGAILMVLGIIGLFLPVLQGILFIILSLTLLSTEYHWPQKIIARFRDYFDKEKNKTDKKKEARKNRKAKRAAKRAHKRLEKRRESGAK